MSARCQFCDEELRPNSMFCANCGQLVASVPPPFGAAAAAAAPIAPSAPRPAEPEKPKRRRIGRVPLPGAFAPRADAEQSATPPPAATPSVTPSPRLGAAPVDPTVRRSLHVKLSTGATLSIGAPAIVGRNPGIAAQEAGIAAVRVDDPSRSVSRAHVRIERAGAGIAVVDLGSANGTEVERADRITPLVTNRPFPLAVGDRVWMGSDFYVDVIGL